VKIDARGGVPTPRLAIERATGVDRLAQERVRQEPPTRAYAQTLDDPDRLG
jgi:hypothetical protein